MAVAEDFTDVEVQTLTKKDRAPYIPFLGAWHCPQCSQFYLMKSEDEKKIQQELLVEHTCKRCKWQGYLD